MSARFYLSDRHRVLMYADLMLLAAPRIPCRGHPSAAGSAESGAKTALELTIVGSGQACGGWFEICPGRLFETGCLADTPGMDDTYIADHYPCALGRLVGNLSSLEWVLRHVLYRLKRPPHAAL